MILEGILLQPPPELLLVRLRPTHTRGNCLPLECRVYFGSFACAYDDGSAAAGAAADDDDVPLEFLTKGCTSDEIRKLCGPRKRLRI